MSDPARLAVILPAGGQSVRFGSNKLVVQLAGRSILEHSISAFLGRADVAQVIVATSQPVPITHPKLIVCSGGAHRALSVRNALEKVADDVQWVAVHDAARPLVSQTLIDRVFAAAIQHGAAVPAMAVHLTVKQAVGPLPARVVRTLPRHELWAMQTPQVMRRDDLRSAFANCPLPLDRVTDDAQLIELIGRETWLVDGEERNLKVTTPMDLRLAEEFLRDQG